jgi:hypothetical protein
MNSIVWKIKSAGTELFMSIRDAYLVFGIQLGILFLLLLFFNKNIFLKITTFALLVATGARGPLIMMILVILVYSVSTKKITSLNPKTILKSVFVSGFLFMVYFLYSNKLDSLLANTFKRFSSLLGGEDVSALERVNRLKYAFNQPFEKLTTFFFGNGVGSFGILYEKIDQRSYPHNILVECFFELGFIGLLIFLILFITILRKMSFKDNVFSLLFLFAFLNAMKSSNITDLWILFSVMGGMLTMIARQTAVNAAINQR